MSLTLNPGTGWVTIAMKKRVPVQFIFQAPPPPAHSPHTYKPFRISLPPHPTTTHTHTHAHTHTHTPVQEPVLHGFKRWEDTVHNYFSLLHDTFLAMGINPRPGSPEIASSSLGRKPDFLSSSGIFSFLTLSRAFTRGLRRVISKASNTMTWCPYPERLSGRGTVTSAPDPRYEWMAGRHGVENGDGRKAKGREKPSMEFKPILTLFGQPAGFPILTW